jgi:YD repeat-containing protein
MMDYTGALQPAIEVYDAQANATGQSISGSNFTGVDVVRPGGGVYTVVAMDASKRPSGGPFGMGLLRTKNACAAPSPRGQTVSGVVSGAVPFVSYTLPAKSGDALAVRSASFTPGFVAQMDLYDPDGARLDSRTFGLSQKAAAAGDYTVIVGASAPRTGGGYALSWQVLNNPAGAPGLQCGGSTTALLSASGEFRYYLAGAGAGDVMRLIFTKISDNFSPQIELFDPAGNRLAATFDITQKAPSDGNYLVVVGPSSSSGETGSFTVAYQRANNPCSPVALACGQTALRQVNIPGQLDAFLFSAVGGDQTSIRLAPRSGSYSPFVELYNAAGARIGTSSSGLLRSILPADGVYALLVRDRGAINTGSYRVSVQDDYNPCAIDDTEPPTMTLLRPTGGEVVAGGATFRIQWQSDDNVAIGSHDITLSTDGGRTFAAAIAGGLSGNAQAYDWAAPPDIAPSRTAMIRVTATDTAGNAQSATSDLLSLIGSGFTPNSSAAYTYDSLNRLAQAILSDGRTIQYTWDAAGNLVQVTISGQ